MKVSFLASWLAKSSPTFAALPNNPPPSPSWVSCLCLRLWFCETPKPGGCCISNFGKWGDTGDRAKLYIVFIVREKSTRLENLKQTTKCPIVIITLVTVRVQRKQNQRLNFSIHSHGQSRWKTNHIWLLSTPDSILFALTPTGDLQEPCTAHGFRN